MSSPYAFAEGINNPRPYRAGDRKGRPYGVTEMRC